MLIAGECMIRIGDDKCPYCNGNLRYFDKAKRTIRTGGGAKKTVVLRRFRCEKCNKIHREIPPYIRPYYRYDARVINGVLCGIVTPDILAFEDYPTEVTMKRWTKLK